MGGFLKSVVIALLMGMWVSACVAAEISAKEANNTQDTKEKVKAIGEQVQDVKKDVLDISKNLIQLDEKLLYPPSTQVLIFLSVVQGEQFHLDTVKINVDGKEATNHSYTLHELDALQHGGIQRIYTGNVRSGEHALDVSYIGKSKSNDEIQKHASYKFSKDVNAKLIEISLAGSGISFRD